MKDARSLETKCFSGKATKSLLSISLKRGEGKTITRLGNDASVSGSYFIRVLRLSFLAPGILQAILRNLHPIDLSAKRLANKTRLPVAWEAQRALLGIG